MDDKNDKETAEKTFSRYIIGWVFNVPEAKRVLVSSRYKPPGDDFLCFQYVERYPGAKDWDEWERRCHYLVAMLLAYHPSTTKYGDFARSVIRLQKSGRISHNTIQRTFLGILKSRDITYMAHRLYWLVSAMKRELIRVNYDALLADLLDWGEKTTLIWGKSFFVNPYKKGAKR